MTILYCIGNVSGTLFSILLFSKFPYCIFWKVHVKQTTRLYIHKQTINVVTL